MSIRRTSVDSTVRSAQQAGGGGGGGAPVDAQYIVAAANGTLTAERVATNTTSVTWDFATAGQAKANVEAEFVQDTVGAMLVDSATIDFTYDDPAGTITAAVVGGTFAPTGASYLTVVAEAGLTAERALAAGRHVRFTDTGANGSLTIDYRPTRNHAFMQDEFLFFNSVAGQGSVGELGWTTSGTATLAAQAGENDHPGIIRFSSGLTVAAVSTIRPSTVASVRVDDVDSMQFIVRPQTLNNDAAYGFGLYVTPTTAANGSLGVYFTGDPSVNANWQCHTRDGAGVTTTTTAVAVAAASWFFFEIRRTSTTWEFYINDVLRATHSTNLPSTSIATPNYQLDAQSILVDTILDIDFFLLESATFGQRWT